MQRKGMLGTALGLSAAGLLLGSSLSAAPEQIDYPEGYQESFTHYATVNRADDRKQVVKVFANDVALASAKDGAPLERGAVLVMEVYKAQLGANEEPVKGADGLFLPGGLSAVTVMEQRAGWGADYPEDLRNGEWDYAAFNPDGSRREIEVESCLSCHKPIADQGYVFTIVPLIAAAGS